MLCYIILNGEKIENLSVEEGAYIIAADGGLRFCKDSGITPNLIIGDFDSCTSLTENSIVYPMDKDFTDGEIALRKAVELGATDIVFACFGGLRDDHFLCNLNLLQIADGLGVKAKALTRYSEIYYVEKSLTVSSIPGDCVSLIAVENSIIKNSSGLKYEYRDNELNRASTLGISNIATSCVIEINLIKGSVYFIINKTLV